MPCSPAVWLSQCAVKSRVVPVVIFTSKEGKEPDLTMASADPKDTKTADEDKLSKPEDEKHLDRDGGERQPTDQSSEK
jgi:hypothetical protein